MIIYYYITSQEVRYISTLQKKNMYNTLPYWCLRHYTQVSILKYIDKLVVLRMYAIMLFTEYPNTYLVQWPETELHVVTKRKWIVIQGRIFFRFVYISWYEAYSSGLDVRSGKSPFILKVHLFFLSWSLFSLSIRQCFVVSQDWLQLD